MHLVVALGVAAATAVLVGALLVGDSVRGSLRHLTLDRLGTIDEVLVVDRFFRQELVRELVSNARFKDHYRDAMGALLFVNGTVERRDSEGVYRAANVGVVATPVKRGGRDGTFWDFGDASERPRHLPGAGQIVLNQALATQLRAHVGDQVTVRLPKPEDIPADSPLGKKTDRIRNLPRLTVVDIIADEGLGAFAMRASQRTPLNAFLSLDTVQQALRQPGKVNAILVAGDSVERPPDARASRDLAAALRPTCTDLGLVVKHPRLTYRTPDAPAERVIYDYFSISSARMILSPEVEQAIAHAFAGTDARPVFTYLANVLRKRDSDQQKDERPVPYSMVTAIDPSSNFRLVAGNGRPIERIGADEIVLTDWAANQMNASVGDQIEITYFKPETSHGQSVEATALLRVAAITPLPRPSKPYLPARRLRFDAPPTMANDPALTPAVEGVIDQRSIDAWEVPFTIDYDRIKPADDEYWQQYGTTPKAFVALATGRRLWGSRFGRATSFRIPAAPGVTEAAIRDRLLTQLAKDGHRLGFDFIPLKRRQLEASSGNTPFDVLFLMLSFFVIAAALMLVAILFRLGFEQRAAQVGLLLAVGWRAARTRRLLLVEGLCVSALGGILGSGIGIGYARLILAALGSHSWWLGAIGTPFLQYHWTVRSLLIGFTAGSLVSTLTIAASIWRARRVSACQLLRGVVETTETGPARPSRWGVVTQLTMLGMAVVLVFVGASREGEARAGAFVGVGTLVLAAWLVRLWQALRMGGARESLVDGSFALTRLAARSAARNPLRSTLTIGLIATASFLIVAMSAFRLRPTDSGTGGFELVGESSQPVFIDLGRAEDRAELAGDAAAVLKDATIFSLRVRPGDDASCGNLYQARQPRILGLPDSLIRYYDDPTKTRFEWTASAAKTARQRANPWHLLEQSPADDDGVIPVVIDHDTAAYSLHLEKGIGEEFAYVYDGRPVRMRVVGLLSISILHGNLLMAEDAFRHQFPAISGYRYFLVHTAAHDSDAVMRTLEDSLSDEGFDAMDSGQILIGLLAIQNTYLRTFQSLGALGLLLGTFGLAIVQWRSVLERRGEIALFRAAGFRHARLLRLLLIENVGLLVVGLLVGVATAFIAVLPQGLRQGASFPFAELGILLALVLVVGILAGSTSAWASLRTPLLSALREEK